MRKALKAHVYVLIKESSFAFDLLLRTGSIFKYVHNSVRLYFLSIFDERESRKCFMVAKAVLVRL